MNLIGDVKGKVAVLVDDMIDTAGTITNAAKVQFHPALLSAMYAAGLLVIVIPPYDHDQSHLSLCQYLLQLVVNMCIAATFSGSRPTYLLSTPLC